MAAELSAEQWGTGRVVRAHLVLAASDFVGFVLLPLFLSALSAVGEKGGQGQQNSGGVLPSEKPLESLFRPVRFTPLVPLPEQALYCLPLPLDRSLQLPFQSLPFPPEHRPSVLVSTLRT